MLIQLAYGKQGLTLDLPDDWNVTVIEPRYVPGLVGVQARPGTSCASFHSARRRP